MKDLIIHRDQAYTPEEWERRQLDLAKERAYNKRPEVRARNREAHRKWVAANREHYLEYKREWTRRKRAAEREGAPPKPVRIGALHAVMCPGGMHGPRKSCRPIPVYDRPVAKMGAVGVSNQSHRITRGAASELTPLAPRRTSSGVSR